MKTMTIISFLLGGLIGFLAYHVWGGTNSTTGHWRTIESYNAYIRDPSNAKPDPQTGLSYVDPPVNDITPHLAALVAAGELQHLDIVLPTVPYTNRAATQHWMSFCERHEKDIVYALGNPNYTAFPTKGHQPLHLNIWFRKRSKPIVQQLISELEDLGPGEKPTHTSISPE